MSHRCQIPSKDTLHNIVLAAASQECYLASLNDRLRMLKIFGFSLNLDTSDRLKRSDVSVFMMYPSSFFF